jgi:8-oxo-dGTP diphosphatase
MVTDDGQPIHVTAGVIARAGRVLVCQRPFDGHHPGKWEFPGGKMEPGEDLATCMRRELEEELGIAATVGRVLWQTRHHYPHYAGVLVNRIFAAIAWVSMGDLATIDFLDGDREFVAQLAGGRVCLDQADK